MKYAVAASARPCVPVYGSQQPFPVHRIYCVGQNYADHAREMGGDPSREPPCFFSKPPDAVVSDQRRIAWPTRTSDLHHEVELVVALASGGNDIGVDEAPGHIFGYAVGVDLTRRDLQSEAKSRGGPWDTAKGFDHSAPLSSIHPIGETGLLERGPISLTVNGELRQRGDIGDMIWSVPEVIAELSTLFTLQAGDLIFTGTPAGVGPLQPGDEVRCSIDKVDSLVIRVG
jgi:fumarylpyruvate hydrolase